MTEVMIERWSNRDGGGGGSRGAGVSRAGELGVGPGYRELANTFLLPHIGSATRETRDAMGFRALDNMDAIFAGREPRGRGA